MKNSRKNTMIFVLFFIVLFCFLRYPAKTTDFAYVGLKTWFDTMIVSLFPFMVLMNILLKTGYDQIFIAPLYYLLKPIFKNSKKGMFVILFGFLCGFPLGAKCVVDLYAKKQLSKENAEYLLAFSNNLGPAYVLSFFCGHLLPGCPVTFALFCCYGIPLLYGIFLRYTYYKKVLDREYSGHKTRENSPVTFTNLSAVFPDAVSDALVQIAFLGGYMILFNALRILPYVLLQKLPVLYLLFQSLLEVSGGLLCLDVAIKDTTAKAVFMFGLLVFNGFCCHVQTFSLLHHSDLSRQKYMLHKLMLCSITMFVVWVFCELNNIKFV